MYVDYRIINEKEIEAINDRGEIIKITGLNTGDIKKAILLSNKIEGLDDKITNQSKIKKYRAQYLVLYFLQFLLYMQFQ